MSVQTEKETRIRSLLGERGLDALLLRRVSSFAWATDSASSYINTATDYGEVALLYTPNGRYLITNNIEAPRLEQEEGLAQQGWESVVSPWYEGSDGVERLTEGMKLGSDGPYGDATDPSADTSQLRPPLTAQESQLFPALARLCADAMTDPMRAIELGQRGGTSQDRVRALGSPLPRTRRHVVAHVTLGSPSHCTATRVTHAAAPSPSPPWLAACSN